MINSPHILVKPKHLILLTLIRLRSRDLKKNNYKGGEFEGQPIQPKYVQEVLGSTGDFEALHQALQSKGVSYVESEAGLEKSQMAKVYRAHCGSFEEKTKDYLEPIGFAVKSPDLAINDDDWQDASVTAPKGSKLDGSLLDREAVIVVDVWSEVFVWLGRKHKTRDLQAALRLIAPIFAPAIASERAAVRNSGGRGGGRSVRGRGGGGRAPVLRKGALTPRARRGGRGAGEGRGRGE